MTYRDKSTCEVIEQSIPPIIPLTLFTKAQQTRLNKLVNKGQLSRTSRSSLLSGYLVCGGCGCRMGTRTRESKNEKMYYCTQSERRFNKAEPTAEACSMRKSINIYQADHQITDIILDILSNYKAMNSKKFFGRGLDSKELSMRRIELEEALKASSQARSLLERSLVKLETSNLLEEYPDRSIYEGAKRKLKKELNQHILDQENLQAQKNMLDSETDWIHWLQEIAHNFKKVKTQSSKTSKAKLFSRIIENIVVNYNKQKQQHKLEINFRIPIPVEPRVVISYSHKRSGYHQTTPHNAYSTVTLLAKFLG